MQTNTTKKMAMVFLTAVMTIGSGAVFAAPGSGSNAGGSDGGAQKETTAPNDVNNKDINSGTTNNTGTTSASGLTADEAHKNTVCKDGRCPDTNSKVETGEKGQTEATKTDGTTH